MKQENERLKVLLYNAISLLADETYDGFDGKEEWLENLCVELGTNKNELKKFGVTFFEDDEDQLEQDEDIVMIKCYGTVKHMKRDHAKAFYLDCMENSEGSECQRYTQIYCQLLKGLKYCSDEMDNY